MSEARLLTLTEAAELSGLSVDAHRKRIKRGRIRSIRDNHGLVRVRLADAELEALKADAARLGPPSQLADESSLVVSVFLWPPTIAQTSGECCCDLEAG